MAEHRIRKNNIIYIIPNDECFQKWKNDEAYIDDYGRLMNRKPHTILKELKHYAEPTLMVQQRTVAPPTASVRKSSPVKDYFKENVRNTAMEVSGIIIDRAVDIFFYEVLPNVWHEHIVPLYHCTKAALTSKELKADAVLAQKRTSADVATNPKPSTKMAREESDAEKRKALYHWLEVLSSLKKLHDAGETDINSTLTQLTEPAMLERINVFLSENPNLLETDRYLLLHSLLGRELYEDGKLLPIEATEIEAVATSHGFKTRLEKPEDS